MTEPDARDAFGGAPNLDDSIRAFQVYTAEQVKAVVKEMRKDLLLGPILWQEWPFLRLGGP